MTASHLYYPCKAKTMPNHPTLHYFSLLILYNTMMAEHSQSDSSNSSNQNSKRLKTSVRLQDTENEGRPSIYLFIFVNPLSGNRQGSNLIHLPIQHFRLRRLPQVQVEIHNCLDPKDQQDGMQRIALIENKVKQNELPPIRSATNNKQTLAHATVDERGHAMSQGEANAAATLPEGSGTLSASVKTRHIHVWSAGGDGTVMSVVNMLEEYGIDLDLVFFSCEYLYTQHPCHSILR